MNRMPKIALVRELEEGHDMIVKGIEHIESAVTGTEYEAQYKKECSNFDDITELIEMINTELTEELNNE